MVIWVLTYLSFDVYEFIDDVKGEKTFLTNKINYNDGFHNSGTSKGKYNSMIYREKIKIQIAKQKKDQRELHYVSWDRIVNGRTWERVWREDGQSRMLDWAGLEGIAQ